MKWYRSNSPKTFLPRTIVSGLFLSIPISLFSVLSVSASPDSCSEPSCDTASSETASELVDSPNLLSQIRPIEPQQPDDERIILDEGPDGRLILDDGTVDIQLLNQTDSTIIFQLTTGDDPQTTMGIIDDTNVTLQDLDAPVDIDLIRPTGGFVQVIPEITAANQLEVTLTEPTSSSDISLVEGTLSVLEDGSIYLDELFLD
jgi:hypothetical protein